MENNKLREMAKNFCKNHQDTNEDDLYIFLVDSQWKFYADYQKQSFKGVIKQELEEQDFDVNNIPDKLIDDMAFNLEEEVFDEGCFRDCISDVFDFYKEDLEEYKVEDCE